MKATNKGTQVLRQAPRYCRNYSLPSRIPLCSLYEYTTRTPKDPILVIMAPIVP